MQLICNDGLENMKYEMSTARYVQYLKQRIVHRSTQDQYPCPMYSIGGADPGQAVSNAKNGLHHRHMATAVSVDNCMVSSPVDASATLRLVY